MHMNGQQENTGTSIALFEGFLLLHEKSVLKIIGGFSQGRLLHANEIHFAIKDAYWDRSREIHFLVVKVGEPVARLLAEADC
jgi:hypothetical protein